MGLEGLPASDLRQLEAWMLELEAELSQLAASRAALLRRVLTAASVCTADGTAPAQVTAAVWRWPKWDWDDDAQGDREELTSSEELEELTPTEELEELRPREDLTRNYVVQDHLGRRRFEFASESVMCVPAGHVLSTSFGRWLRGETFMRPLLIGLSVMLLVLVTVGPLSELIPHDGPLHLPRPCNQTITLCIWREGLLVWLVEGVGFPLFWFLMLHYVNAELAMMALFTFDAGVIVLSFAISELAQFYNKMSVWRPLGYYDNCWLACDVLHTLIVVFPVALAMVTLDSWKVNSAARNATSRLKLILLFTVICYFIKSCYSNSVGLEKFRWEDNVVCIGPICGTPQKFFLQAEIQKVIFLSGAIAKYAGGNAFAFIRAPFIGRGVIQGPGNDSSGDESDILD